MGEMVERVAAKLAAVQMTLPGAGGLRGTVHLAPAQAREYARAAIEAMRPTEFGDLPEAMCIAGEGAIDQAGHGSYAAAHHVFSAMIDAALT